MWQIIIINILLIQYLNLNNSYRCYYSNVIVYYNSPLNPICTLHSNIHTGQCKAHPSVQTLKITDHKLNEQWCRKELKTLFNHFVTFHSYVKLFLCSSEQEILRQCLKSDIVDYRYVLSKSVWGESPGYLAL